MADKRVVTRQEPITVEVASTQHVFEAKPIFWRDRQDFGTAIAADYSHSMEGIAPRITQDETGNSHLLYEFNDLDYQALLKRGYPAEKNGAFDKLDIWEMVELLKVAMEANGLQKLAYMVDPRIKDPLTAALDRAAEASVDGLKMPSSTDASSLESIPTPPPAEMAL